MSDLRDPGGERRDMADDPEPDRPIDRQELLRTFRPSDRHYTPTDQLTNEEIIAQFKEERRRLGKDPEDPPVGEDDGTADGDARQVGESEPATEGRPEAGPLDDDAHVDEGERTEHRSWLEATKADLDAAYASGDKAVLAQALREALAKVEGRPEPERQTSWRTIAEEMGGEVRALPNYEAAKRALGAAPGTEIHHIVEQAQANPDRSGFELSRLNSTDNLTRIPPELHREISSFYSSKPLGWEKSIRDSLNNESWEEQYAFGSKALDRIIMGDDDDD